MAERILKLRALHCKYRSSESLVEGKKSSILKISKHKKHLSVRFVDQVPMASIKTLMNEIDMISSNIETCFKKNERKKEKEDSGEDGVALGFGGLKKSCVKRNFGGSLGGNEVMEEGKVFEKGRKGGVVLNRKYRNLVRPEDAGETDMRIVKKKILPCSSQKVLKNSKSLAVGHAQGYYHPSPKIVKQSIDPTILQKRWGKSIPLFKNFQNSLF